MWCTILPYNSYGCSAERASYRLRAVPWCVGWAPLIQVLYAIHSSLLGPWLFLVFEFLVLLLG